MKKFLYSLLSTLLLLLLFGLQSALGCPSAPGTEHYTAPIQVNACHFHVAINPADICCDSAACHRNNAPLRHFGSPEFANQIKDLLPLILESRQQAPQSKTVTALSWPAINPQSIHHEPVTSIVPRHALAFLRTTILLQ